MPLPATRPSTWPEGFALASLAALAPVVATVAWLLGAGDTAFIPGTVGTVLLGTMAVRAFRRVPRSQSLLVQADTLLWLEGDRVVGRLPMANIDTIKTAWNKDEPSRSATGQITVLWDSLHARSSDPVAVGIEFKLYDKDDPGTLWPDFGSPPRTYFLYLVGEWDRPYARLLEDLRQAHIDYLKANNLLPLENDDADPFDFS